MKGKGPEILTAKCPYGNRTRLNLPVVLLFCAVTFLLAGNAAGEPQKRMPAPVILNAIGPVDILVHGRWRRTQVGQRVQPNQWLRTGPDDLLWLSLDIGNSLTVYHNSLIDYRPYQGLPLLELREGNIYIHLHRPQSLSVLTKNYFLPHVPVGHFKLSERRVRWEWPPPATTTLWYAGKQLTIVSNRSYDLPPARRLPVPEPTIAAAIPAPATGLLPETPIAPSPLVPPTAVQPPLVPINSPPAWVWAALGMVPVAAAAWLFGLKWQWKWKQQTVSGARIALLAALENPTVVANHMLTSSQEMGNQAERTLVNRINLIQALIYEARAALRYQELQPLRALPVSLQMEVCAEIGPYLQGIQHRYLMVLAGEMGLIDRAERHCRSWWWRRRLRAIQFLTAVGGRDDAVLPLLRDRHPLVRRQVIRWIASHPSPDLVSHLRNLVTDPLPPVRAAAAEALEMLGNSATPPGMAEGEGSLTSSF